MPDSICEIATDDGMLEVQKFGKAYSVLLDSKFAPDLINIGEFIYSNNELYLRSNSLYSTFQYTPGERPKHLPAEKPITIDGIHQLMFLRWDDVLSPGLQVELGPRDISKIYDFIKTNEDSHTVIESKHDIPFNFDHPDLENSSVMNVRNFVLEKYGQPNAVLSARFPTLRVSLEDLDSEEYRN